MSGGVADGVVELSGAGETASACGGGSWVDCVCAFEICEERSPVKQRTTIATPKAHFLKNLVFITGFSLVPVSVESNNILTHLLPEMFTPKAFYGARAWLAPPPGIELGSAV